MKSEDCLECENEAVLDLVDLQIEYERLLVLNKRLEECLRAKEGLCEFYYGELDHVKTKYHLWKEKAQDLERLNQ